MKSIFTIFFLFTALLLNAQSNIHVVTRFDFEQDFVYYRGLNEDSDYIKTNKIESQTALLIRKGKEFKSVLKYNREGNLVSRMSYNEKGIIYSTIEYEYDGKNRLIKTTSSYKNNPRHIVRYVYNSNDVLVATSIYDEKKGHQGGHKDIYGSDGKLMSQLVFEKDSVTPFKRLDYTYYEDGSKESIKYYIGSKVKYTWSFECKESGELVQEKTQDSTLICIKEEHDNEGNRVVWTQEFNSKGEPQKTKFVYAPDSLLLTCTRFDAEEKIRSHQVSYEDGGYQVQYYDKKEKISNTYEKVCNKDGLVVKSSYISKKDYGIYLFAYEKGLLCTEVHTYNNDFGDHGSFTEYSYTFF